MSVGHVLDSFYISFNFLVLILSKTTLLPRDFYWIKFQSQAVNTPANFFSFSFKIIIFFSLFYNPGIFFL